MVIFTISLLTFVASAIGTLTGFGTSTILIPVLVNFLLPIEAIFLGAIIHWFGNVWKILLFRKGFDLHLLIFFGIVGLITSYVGAFISLGSSEAILLQVLGFFLIIYALFLIFRSSFKIPAVNTTAVLGGGISGFFAGMFGLGGAIRSMFLLAFNLPKAVYIATAGAIGLIVDTTRIITYFSGGTTLSDNLWWGLLVFIPVSFLGAQMAKRIVDRIPQDKFRAVIAIFLFLMGIKLLIWP
jgi:uncharacterized protein